MRQGIETVWPIAVLLLLLLQTATSGIWCTHALSAGDQNKRRLLQSVSGNSRALKASPGPDPASAASPTPGPTPGVELQKTGVVGSAGECPPLPGAANVANGAPVLNAAVRYPYMVSLRTPNVPWARPGNPGHYCAGTLIAQNLVLTAAHCIFESIQKGDMSGSWHPDYNATTNKSPGGLTLIDFPTAVIGTSCTAGVGTDSVPVIEVLIHPGFTGDVNDGFDVGLMRLKRSVTPPVTPIALNKEPSDMLNLPAKDVPPGDALTFIGYGANITGGYPSPNLNAANVTLSSLANCAPLFPSIFRSQLCTAKIGTSTCQGDSGGPLLVARDMNPQHDIQVGIISFGPPLGCGGSNSNSVFTRVASFTSESATLTGLVSDPNQSVVDDWIGGHLNDIGNQVPVTVPSPPPPPLLPPASAPALAPVPTALVAPQSTVSPQLSPTAAAPQQNGSACFTVPSQLNLGNPVTNAAVRYPYMVSLQTVNPTAGSPGNPGHYCDGTLIAQNLVLTSGYCVNAIGTGGGSSDGSWNANFTSPANIAPDGSFIDYPTAVIGSSCSAAAPGIDSIPVSKAIIHPGSTGNGNDGFDIAILILQRPAKPEAIPVKLDIGAPMNTLNLPAKNVPQGAELLFLNYGPLLVTSGDSTLDAAKVSLESRAQCSFIAGRTIYLSQLCTYGTQKLVNSGGGPLLVTRDASPANDIQVGINSLQYSDNRTSAFTRIASYNAPAVSPGATPGNADQLDVDNWVSETVAKYGISGAN